MYLMFLFCLKKKNEICSENIKSYRYSFVSELKTVAGSLAYFLDMLLVQFLLLLLYCLWLPRKDEVSIFFPL